MISRDFIVIGGGIAGLSVLHYLSGKGRGCLLEREPVLSAHSSGRNAAIFRPLEADRYTGRLAARSMQEWERLLGPGVLRPCGLLLVSADQTLVELLAAVARKQRITPCRVLDRDALREIASTLQGGQACYGVLVGGGGVLDIHAMITALDASARAAGAEIYTEKTASRVLLEQNRVCGVELMDGMKIAAPVVVIAAGAWSRELGASCGAPLPLTPRRRHLVQLNNAIENAERHPVVWRLEDEVYYRPESGGVLASPCDETDWPAADPVADPAALELLAAKLSRLSPVLCGAAVRRSWACLRTFTPDCELVAGANPRVSGLFWLAALGGRGMSIGLAVGELVAALIAGEKHELAEPLSPARLL